MPTARRKKPVKKKTNLKLAHSKKPEKKKTQQTGHPFAKFINRPGEVRHHGPVQRFYQEPPRKKAV